MAKFCSKCGKKLEDGKPCDCEKNDSKVESKTSTSGFDFNECVNSYIDIVKKIFCKPVDAIKKYSTENKFSLGIIALVINCIITGIFVYCLLNEASGALGSLFGYSSLLSGSIFKVEFMKTFINGFIFMAVWFVIAALVIYLIANPILKDRVNIKSVFSLLGVCSVFTTITTVVAIICVYISIKLSFIILLIAALFYLTHLYQGINEITKVDKNKLAYVFVPAVSVAIFVVVYVLPKIMF